MFEAVTVNHGRARPVVVALLLHDRLRDDLCSIVCANCLKDITALELRAHLRELRERRALRDIAPGRERPLNGLAVKTAIMARPFGHSSYRPWPLNGRDHYIGNLKAKKN